MTKLDFPFFFALVIFINNILNFAFNTYRKLRDKQDDPPHIQFRNSKAEDPSTLSRRVNQIDENFIIHQDNVKKGICIKSKWLDRHLRQGSEWLTEHVGLNKFFEKKSNEKEKKLWQQFASNRQRLINIVYTCVNNHIPDNKISEYRKAVS